MRPIRFVLVALLVSVPGGALAQEWSEFASREDRFTVNFPGPPQISDTTWSSEYGAVLPARLYTAGIGPSRFSVTAVDYSGVEQRLTEKAKSCPAGAETCSGIGDTGVGYWKNDVRGAIAYATWTLIQRSARATHFMWNSVEMVSGNQLQLTNADGSRTFASIYMHENKLVIVEGTVRAGYPEPGLFQQSLGWLDENGQGIRYSTLYINEPDLPKPAIRVRGQRGQAR
jgi:hypothetical protein